MLPSLFNMKSNFVSLVPMQKEMDKILGLEK
jgi:hypothetical protein